MSVNGSISIFIKDIELTHQFVSLDRSKSESPSPSTSNPESLPFSSRTDNIPSDRVKSISNPMICSPSQTASAFDSVSASYSTGIYLSPSSSSAGESLSLGKGSCQRTDRMRFSTSSPKLFESVMAINESKATNTSHMKILGS